VICKDIGSDIFSGLINRYANPSGLFGLSDENAYIRSTWLRAARRIDWHRGAQSLSPSLRARP
jgi:hypothetical protein